MPRPEYYNLRRTEFRQMQIEAIARKLGLNTKETATWGIVIDFVLGLARTQIDSLSLQAEFDEGKPNDP